MGRRRTTPSDATAYGRHPARPAADPWPTELKTFDLAHLLGQPDQLAYGSDE